MMSEDINEDFDSAGGLQRSLVLLMLFSFVIVSSGCVATDARLDMRDVNDEELAELTTEDFSYLQQMNPGIRYVFLNGSSNSTADIPYDVREYDEPVEFNGSYYRIERSKIGETEEVSVRYIGKRVDSNKETEVNFSEKDKEILKQISYQARRSDYEAPKRIFGGDYTPEQFRKSNIVNFKEIYVSKDNITFRLKKEKVRNVTKELYNYTSRKVANKPDEWTEELKEEYMITLDSSNHSREFLENATEGYYGEETPEFINTVNILRNKKAYRETEKSGRWIANYRNNTYWVEASWDNIDTR
jgi:hypothetical protein